MTGFWVGLWLVVGVLRRKRLAGCGWGDLAGSFAALRMTAGKQLLEQQVEQRLEQQQKQMQVLRLRSG
jgi:hypothetical protein